jgi:hypothetical protein
MSQDIFNFLQQSNSAASDYVKFQDGDKKSLRIISQPVMGWELFVDNKPVRWEDDAQRPEHAYVRDERPKKFVAFVVYEYAGQSDSGAVKIWSFSQRTIIDQMAMLFKEEHWTAFELVISRKGKGLDTKYNVTGIKSPIEDTLLEFAAETKKYIKLDNLFTGENPFIADLPTVEAKQAKQEPNDLPF